MKLAKKLLALTLCAVLLIGCIGYIPPVEAKAAADWTRGLNGAMGWNEDTYYTIEKRTGNNNWRQALATANGEIALMESGDPNEDVFIFNNTKIVYDDNGVHEVPQLADIIDQQRVGAINHNNWIWNQAANTYDQNTYGISGGRGMVWSRPYMPAGQYRIKNNDYTAANKTNYNRYTNYETAEVGAQWKDASGNEWNRRSFASREDDVIVTYIEAPAGKNLNLTISMDHLTDMRNAGSVNPMPGSDYVVTQESGQVVGFGILGKFAIRDITGSKNTGNKTLFSYGGWATATRIVLGSGGTVAYNAATRTVNNAQANDPRLTVTGTSSIMLITKVDRQDDGCQNLNDIRTKLYDRLQNEIAELIADKGIESREESYQKLLAPHAAIHGGMFNNIRIDLCQTAEEKADRELTNAKLIAKQNSNKSSINKAFLERVYNNGRFGVICAHGYGSSRLGGIWCGTWAPDWSGDYTLDANTNLQVSGLNTGNMMEAGNGYISFILRMVADWETNASGIYGMTDAILGPPRVDGTGQGQSYHYSNDYPHVFVNGITDWLLIPIFEYWQCYGNQQIPVGKDISLERNRSVLDLSDADIARITADGYMDLEKDILYPLSMKAMNFWTQFVDEKYYTDGQGKHHVADGTTLSQALAKGDKDAKYIFAPGFSPENSPQQGGARPGALAFNVSMDIAAAHDTLFIARTMVEQCGGSEEKLAEWAEFESLMPEYLYETKTGEFKEWASTSLREAHNHRHESHAYAAWPGYEAQDSRAIRDGLAIAMDMRSAAYNGQEAPESHGATHKALVEARLKRPLALQRVMLYLLTNGYQYDNMLTSHNNNHSSCLCTDSAFGLMGAVNESLLYSNTGVVEILPTLLPNLTSGSITGLRARNNTQVDIRWNPATAAASLTTDEEAAQLKLMCGLEWSKASLGGKELKIQKDAEGRSYVLVDLKKGESTEVVFTLTADDDSKTRDAYGVLKAASFDEARGSITAQADGSVAQTGSADLLAFKNLDFGASGCKPRVTLHVANSRTSGGLNADGSATIKLYTADPDKGNAVFAQTTVKNTGGKYQAVELALPSRLRGVQDIYIKFQDGGASLASLEFAEMTLANVTEGQKVSISAKYPLVLELDTDAYSFKLNGASVTNGQKITEAGDWTLTASRSGQSDQVIHFSTYISEANRLLPKNVSGKPGDLLQLAANLNDPSLTVWVAPANATVFKAGSNMTSAPGNAAQIAAPSAEGTYCIAVVNARGEVLSRSDAAVKVFASGLADIDFTDPASADLFEVVNKDATSIREGEGLYMICTKNGFEPANDQLSGDAATNPKDLLIVPVAGDWEATLKFRFNTGSAGNGYYQFFGFYAMEDYNNCAGIRGGDGSLQDFIRKDGAITHETMTSSPGLAQNNAMYWFKIAKEGDTYTCYRSEDGESFTEIFAYENTGIKAEKIAIDAYTGMTEGYTFYLQSLTFEGGGAPVVHVHEYTEVVTAPTCTEKGYTTYTCACGDSYVGDEVAALGHDVKETTAAATCTEAGSVTKTCTRCDYKEVSEIPARGHAYENGKCIYCGLKSSDYICGGGEDCPSKDFTDAPKPSSWSHAGIDYCVETGLMKGISDSIFKPNGTVTRGQLVTILYRIAGEPEFTTDKQFSDVAEGRYYTKAVLWAAENEIVTGYADGTFLPNREISREQIATILYRYAGKPAASGTLSFFPDSSQIGSYAYDALLWATQEGLITGVKTVDGTFLNPKTNATRAQIAAIITRYLEAK